MKQKLLVFIICMVTISFLKAQEISSAARAANYKRDTIALDVVGESMTSTGGMQALNAVASASTEVGQTAGELSVSATGGASYTVPIAVPPGINGVEPDIALTYNSQGGNGLAGWGWNVSGISVITRIPATEFHDNMVEGVDFTATDRFALDGQRLLLKSGTVYETENYSNIKITSHGTSPYGSAYGPAHFKVMQPDGSIAFYGQTPNSRSRTDYAITYWENPQGLRVTYTYETANNGLSIKSITYGSKGTTTPINKIEFIYGSRSRKEQAYIGEISFIRSNILKEIKVTGKNAVYRRYVLSHNTTTLGYQRLTGVQEWGEDGTVSYNPVVFSYTNSPTEVEQSSIDVETGVSDLEQRNSEVVSGDFTGNGKMDFIVYPSLTSDPAYKKKFWLFSDLQDEGKGDFRAGTSVNTGRFEEIFPINYISGIPAMNNRIPSKQGLVLVKYSTNFKVNFEVYGEVSASTGSIIGPHYTKSWNSPTYTSPETGTHGIPRMFISGDFNGDGLSDVVSITKPYSYRICHPGHDPNCDNPTVSVHTSKVYLIELDKRKNTGFSMLSGTLSDRYDSGDKIYTMDVTGDGKTNILHIKSEKAIVYGLGANNQLELLWQTPHSSIKPNLPLMVGDYNGDGKTDFMIPEKEDTKNFTLFISTGKSFKDSNNTYPFEYKKTNFNDTGSTLYGYNLIPVDVNGDGRTDILDHRTTTYTGNSNGTQSLRLYNNVAPVDSEANPRFIYSYFTSTQPGKLENFPIPIFLSSNRPNANLDFATISNKWVKSFKFLKDHREDVMLRSVVNNGVKESITYSPLDPLGIPLVYSAERDVNKWESYPYMDIKASWGTQVVSKLERTGTGITTLQQLFTYHGAVSHVEGLGFLGFKKLARSNWHKDYSDRIYSTSFHNPQLRGATTLEFTSINPINNESGFLPEPAPLDITLSSVTTGTKTAIQSITLKPGFSANGSNGAFHAKMQGTAANDGASSPENDYISRTDYKYSTETHNNKVFVNVPTMVVSKDLLNETLTTKTYNYDSYKNLLREHTDISGKGTHTVTMAYKNSTGTTYYIGRPTKKTETRTAYGNTYTTEEGYDYTGFFLTEVKTKGHGTDFMIEARKYDTYGNLTEKSVTPPGGGTPRMSEYEYNSTYGGRFLTKVTGPEGLETSYVYDPNNGSLKKETNPLSQATTYDYDTWGKVTKVTDYRGNNVTTAYTKSGNLTTITETGNDGSSKVSIYDMLGQLTRVREKDVLGQWIEKAVKYDHLGREVEVSEPYIGGATQWNTTEYDLYGRIKRTTSHTGKATTITYNGLTTTVSDGTKTVTTTKDALGNVEKVTDPGGTINYTYYANGTLKTADYGGSVQRTEQDGWGRKTKLTDPSAGVYTYEYNGYGEMTKETTPKGTTTYEYDNYGKLVNKKLEGDHTDMAWVYTYKTDTKLPEKTTLTNADGNNTVYALTYDTTHPQLVKQVVETNPHAVFTRKYTYDGFSRVQEEEFIAKNRANSKTSTKKIKRVYQNGGLKRISDNATQDILWEVTGRNARGQLTEVALGASLKQVNSYDAYGFPTQRKTQKISSAGTVTTVATLGYDFNTQRGTLNSRSNSMFSWNETFQYDNLDRLTHFNDNNGNNSQTYDGRGRITKNSAIGNYAYAGVSYQNTKITIDEEALIPGSTEAARQYYQDHPEQKISYNAFKSPVEINEQGKERINFQYNASMGRAHMYYGGENSDKMQRRYRKHYSADGSMEIKEDTQTGKTTFITYIGGDAYSAPLIWHSDQGTTTTNNYYYLHRDYLGSILSITDKNGTVKEKRHFDAWGNIVKLTNGSGTALNNFTILDRGYTGHEHLAGVGLVHMNGRLYDPVMHRFLMPDNYVQDPFNTQNFNRYGYVLNNPLMYVDQNGEFFWIAVGIGALIGAVTQAIKPGANFGKILGGALIGAAAGAIGAGVGNIVSGGGFFASKVAVTIGGAALGGAAGGVVNAGLSATFFGGNIGKGILQGGLTGFISGGLGTYLGGGTGALVGGATAGALGAAMNGENVFFGALIGGTVSYGLYHAINYYNYKKSNLKDFVNYKSFSKLSGDYQRSIARRKEFGGVISDNGKYYSAPAKYRHNFAVDFDPAWTSKIEGNPLASFHTHWENPGLDILVNANMDFASNMDVNVFKAITSDGPSPGDWSMSNNARLPGILIDKTTSYIYLELQTKTIGNFDTRFTRRNPFHWLW
ncbi:RHS repeat-associated core domain-containing protein [Sinomicrobium sp. M5D2P17]